jgi:hypothetical protein
MDESESENFSVANEFLPNDNLKFLIACTRKAGSGHAEIIACTIVGAVIAPVLAATVATATVVTTYNLHQEFVEREREEENIEGLCKSIIKHSNVSAI